MTDPYTPRELQLMAERDQARLALQNALREWSYITRESESAQHQLEEHNVGLYLANRDLHEVARLKSQFYANMNHELRTPLNSIIGFAEDALDGLAGDLNPEQHRYVGNILTSSLHLLRVITDILDVARMQSGKETLELTAVPLQSIIDQVDSMLSPLILRKKQRFTLPVVRELPAVRADASKLLQVFINLISNAHKYTPAGGHIELRARVEHGMMRVEFLDDGIGIESGDLPYLFEEFTHVAKKHKKQPHGTGLGLAITKSLVELHGGQLAVTSAVGVGSTFVITLPLADADAEA